MGLFEISTNGLVGDLGAQGQWHRLMSYGRALPLMAERVAFDVCQVQLKEQKSHDIGPIVTDAVDSPKESTTSRLWVHDDCTSWQSFVRIDKPGGGQQVTFGTDAFRLTTQWSSAGQAVRINGELTSCDDGEYACLLRFRVPWAFEQGMRWWQSIGQVSEVEASGTYSQTLVPIAAVTSADAGVALAVPPDAPCYFKAEYDAQIGLSMTMRLGLCPRSHVRAKGAAFSLLVMPTDPQWGLRDALEKYYDLFDRYYQRRTEKYGLWFMGRASDYPDPDLLMFSEVGEDFTRNTDYGQLLDMAQDNAAHGLVTFPYTIVGVCHVIHRRCHAESVEQLNAVLNDPSPQFTPWHRACMTLNRHGDQAEMLENVLAGAVGDPQGQVYIYQRDIQPLFGLTVSIVCNPSPGLGEDCKGQRWLAASEKMMAHDVIEGVYVDSLGRWCDYFDYRPEHMAVTDLGLSFLDDGRLGKPNKFSHYEYLLHLRQALHGQDKLLFGNGVHQGTWRDGRFFLAALLDIAGSESGPRTSLNKYDLCRTYMGSKPYLLFSQGQWGSRKQVERYFKYSTLYAIAPSFFPRYYMLEDQVDQDTSFSWVDPAEPDLPAGTYARDRDLHKQYLPVIRRLHAAGWQPVTHALASDSRIRVERYGVQTPQLLVAVLNPTSQAIGFSLVVDETSLGIVKPVRLEPIVGAAAVDSQGWCLGPGEVEVFVVTERKHENVRTRATAQHCPV